jgi:hypothetical protein
LRSVRSVVPLVLLIALVAPGCGGESTETTTTPDETQLDERPPSKADYIALGDTICKNHQSRREDLESQASDLGRIGSEEEAHRIAELLRQEGDNRLAEVQELARLQPPVADAAKLASILSLIRAEAKVIDDWADAYDDLRPEAIRRLQLRLGAIAAKARDSARAYGFKLCGQH